MLARVTGAWWVLPAIVSVLRGLPFLVTQQADPDVVTTWMPVAYVPKDSLQYVAMLRQVPDGQGAPFVNPFTTEPQSGRFILLLFVVLGWVSRLTGLDPFWTLELSRVPLCFALFWTVQRLCRSVFSERTHQQWAYWLIGLSGGLEVVALVAKPWLPDVVRASVTQDLWHLHGWSTFAACSNPLWIAGLALTLIALEPILRPTGPSRLRDMVQIAAAVALLHWTHVYSEITVLAIAVGQPVVSWLLGGPVVWPRIGRTLGAVGAALAIILPVLAWQLADPVFARSSSGIWGSQQLPVFWYPLTLGVLLAFAVWGLQALVASDHPWWRALVGWVAAVVFLHTSPIVNGYHFVFHLHLPVALMATPAVAGTMGRLWRSGASVRAALLGLVLFVSPAVVTWQSLTDVRQDSRVAKSVARLVQALALQPPGNVLAPWKIGNVIPAYGPHRVWVGHWFLTPDYRARARRYGLLVETPGREDELVALLEQERIRYLVVPAEAANRIATVVARRLERARRFEGAVLLTLRDAV